VPTPWFARPSILFSGTGDWKSCFRPPAPGRPDRGTPGGLVDTPGGGRQRTRHRREHQPAGDAADHGPAAGGGSQARPQLPAPRPGTGDRRARPGGTERRRAEGSSRLRGRVPGATRGRASADPGIRDRRPREGARTGPGADPGADLHRGRRVGGRAARQRSAQGGGGRVGVRRHHHRRSGRPHHRVQQRRRAAVRPRAEPGADAEHPRHHPPPPPFAPAIAPCSGRVRDAAANASRPSGSTRAAGSSRSSWC